MPLLNAMRDVSAARLHACIWMCLFVGVTICSDVVTLFVHTPSIKTDMKVSFQSNVSSQQQIRYRKNQQRQPTATPCIRREVRRDEYWESMLSKLFQTLLGVDTFLKKDENLESTPRIVNGTNVTDTFLYPQYAFTYGTKLCGGTLIYPDVILSAAHCQGAWLDGLVLGGIRADGADGGFYSVEQEYPHPDYNGDTDENDIMLVKLEQPISNIPLQMINFDHNVPSVGEEVTIIGIGYIQEGGPFAQFLQQVQVNIVGFEQCNADFNRIVDEIMVCTYADARDACQGDSGGPLLTENGAQVGIVSFGIGCARPDIPAVFTRTSAYERFIANGICNISSIPPDNCDGDESTSSSSQPSGPFSPGPLSFAPGAGPISAAPSAYTSNGETSPPNTTTPFLTTIFPTIAPSSPTTPTSTSGPSLPAQSPSSIPDKGTMSPSWTTKQPSMSPLATPTNSGAPEPIGPSIPQPSLEPSSNQFQFVPTAIPAQQIYDPILSQPSPNQIIPTVNISPSPVPTGQKILDPILFQLSQHQLSPTSPATTGQKILDPILLMPSPFQVQASFPTNEIPPSLFLPSPTLSSSTTNNPTQLPIPKSVFHPTVFEQINAKPKRNIFNNFRQKGKLANGKRNEFKR